MGSRGKAVKSFFPDINSVCQACPEKDCAKPFKFKQFLHLLFPIALILWEPFRKTLDPLATAVLPTLLLKGAFSPTSPSIQARPGSQPRSQLQICSDLLQSTSFSLQGLCSFLPLRTMDPQPRWDRCSPVHPPGCLFKVSAPHWPLFHTSFNPSGLILFFFCLFRSSHPVISAIESDVLGSLLTAGSENRQRPPDVSEQDFVFGVVFAEPRIFHPRGCTYPQPRAGREPCVLEGELSAIYTKAPFSPAEGPPWIGTPDRVPNHNTSGQVNPHGDSILF